MKLKKLIALGMATVMTLSLTACGGGSNEVSTTKDSSNDTVSNEVSTTDTKTEDDTTAEGSELTYASITLGEDYTDLTASIKWMHHKTDREEDGTIQAYIDKFNETYPNITVEHEGITDYAESALLRLPMGDWGDIMFIPSIDMVDLETYFLPYGTVSEMSELVNFADQWKYQDMCYGVGYMGNAQGVLYNKAVFEKAGITKLPTTPDEFIADLQLIKDNTDAIPLYTNYAAGWTMGGQWDSYLGAITTGDTTWLNQKFTHTAEPFADAGDGTGAYALYKVLYDAVANGLIEDDYTTTDWEGCKGMINRGEIGTMFLGSWAIAQMKAAGENPDDIGYMPFPMTINGKQYATAGPDYCYGINANTDKDRQTASMVFVKWMVEESSWCDFEGGYPISKTAPTSFVFDGVEIVNNDSAAESEADLMNQMNAESELNFNNGGDSKVMKIVEDASAGVAYDDIMAEWTQKWNDAQSSLGVEVLY